jgi:hypothetical protein
MAMGCGLDARNPFSQLSALFSRRRLRAISNCKSVSLACASL